MKKGFFDHRYLLDSDTAVDLYNKFAKDLPIYDYHCHLSPKDIAEDRVYTNIGELWLEGDHYKWRMMRACGVPEEKITGSASWHDKFIAFASIMPRIIGSPVYHWAHLELKVYFDIVRPMNADSAEEIWEAANAKMADGSFSARKLIVGSNVEALCTTDDPADTLEFHKAIAEDDSFSVKVLPSFRPDMICTGLLNPGFKAYLTRLETVSGMPCNTFDGFLSAVESRLDFFVENGCKVSDISLGSLSEKTATYEEAKAAFEAVLAGKEVSGADAEAYCDYMLRRMAKGYAQRGMAMQLHFSAIRNNNTARFAALGADCGNDSVGPAISVASFGRFLDAIEKDGGLPKTIVYTLNEPQYYELATMIGNFWGDVPGKLQLGAAWWFCDHVEGIKNQLKMASASGALGVFNGMLTDSRSFTSYPRHDFFRRILCSYIANFVDNGEYDSDEKYLAKLIGDICIDNVRNFLK